MRRVYDTFKNTLTDLLKNDSGSIATYVAAFSVLGLGLGALSIDTGRATVLRSQMQNRADAGAMAGAAQLDGARARASEVAINASTSHSLLASNGSELSVQSVDFYQQIEPSLVAADSDENAKFIQVTMAPKNIDYIFTPSFSGTTSPTQSTLGAQAIAQPDPYLCHAPPLMICDLGEINPQIDIKSNAIVGHQIVLKPPQGGGAWAPGNYGLLALPDGSIGANALEDALAAVQPQDCYGLDVGTAPGVKTNKVQNGINARFEYETNLPYPAPNVIHYPRDEDIESGAADNYGNATWDLATYWADKHGTPLPDDLIDATRFQVYLYELGETYGRNGRLTQYPVEGGLNAGFSEVVPPSASIPTDSSFPNDPAYDGVPSEEVAPNGAARRLVQVAILECVADDVRGSHNYPTNGRYLEMFLTESVPNAPEGGIYAEVVRPLTPTVTPDFHANVKLVR